METITLKNDTVALQKEIKEVFELFIASFDKLTNELINAEPKTGSWTIGQLAQHVALATSGLPDQKNKKADRPADQLEPSIRETFMDDTHKLKSPEFITPEKKTYDKQLLLKTLEDNEAALLRIIKEKDLGYFCMDMDLPGWGNLTRYEWIKLISYHVQRHTRQLKRLTDTYNN